MGLLRLLEPLLSITLLWRAVAAGVVMLLVVEVFLAVAVAVLAGLYLV
jgi:hypothetical protein